MRPPLDEKVLFQSLAKKTKRALLPVLQDAFKQMTEKQRQAVFGAGHFDQAQPLKRRKSVIDPKRLLQEAAAFRRDSLAKKYYAPFNMDSKNYSHVPAQTVQWCDRFARLVKSASALTAAGEHTAAARCFGALFELLLMMSSGDGEIVFAHEMGSWMIPADDKKWLKYYIKSLAATATPEAFAAAVAPILRYDSWQSFSADAYASARRFASVPQRTALEAERLNSGIRIPSDPQSPRR
jgi:hypothetical protein